MTPEETAHYQRCRAHVDRTLARAAPYIDQLGNPALSMCIDLHFTQVAAFDLDRAFAWFSATMVELRQRYRESVA